MKKLMRNVPPGEADGCRVRQTAPSAGVVFVGGELGDCKPRRSSLSETMFPL